MRRKPALKYCRSNAILDDPSSIGQFRTRYTNAAQGVQPHVDHTGTQQAARENCGPAPNDAREFDHFDDFVTVDMSIFIKAGKEMRSTILVANLSDCGGKRYFS